MKLCIDCDNRIEDTEKRCGECIARIESLRPKKKITHPRPRAKIVKRNCLICKKEFEVKQLGLVLKVYCSPKCAKRRYS